MTQEKKRRTTDRPGGGAMDGATDLFFAGDHMLEGTFEESEHDGSWGGVVVAHPHPLYGGTMAQPVVFRVAKTCREHGLATLRFNFPGVGRSGGRYTGKDEYLDVQAALAHLQERLGSGSQSAQAPPGSEESPLPVVSGPPLGLAGYSFGSVMAALACIGPVPVEALALIAFPADWQDRLPEAFERLSGYRGPVLAVCGEEDDIAPPAPLEQFLGRVGVDFRMEVLPGAGHLFEGSRKEVGRLVGEFMAEELGRSNRSA